MTKPGNGDAQKVSDGQLFELLRYSHIFASVIREILEIKLLNEVTPNSLTLSQFHLLKLISLNGKHQVGQVADFLGVSPPAATKNIDKLEGLGLVYRRQSKGDRRATLLSSSAKGRRLVEKYETLKAERLTPVINAFSTDELDQLARWLERFSLALLHAEESGEGLCFRCSAYFEEQCPVTHLHEGCPYQKVRGSHVTTTGEKEA
ncbi:MAG: MarR family transcriptional regulator [Acidobacteria bacterium]|nr:MAG: MarR family transcriptional regulator [Acidobacteriota bacterium]